MFIKIWWTLVAHSIPVKAKMGVLLHFGAVKITVASFHWSCLMTDGLLGFPMPVVFEHSWAVSECWLIVFCDVEQGGCQDGRHALSVADNEVTWSTRWRDQIVCRPQTLARLLSCTCLSRLDVHGSEGYTLCVSLSVLNILLVSSAVWHSLCLNTVLLYLAVYISRSWHNSDCCLSSCLLVWCVALMMF